MKKIRGIPLARLKTLTSKKKLQTNLYTSTSNMYPKNHLMTQPMIIGCVCGNARITEEWDEEYGAAYCVYECELCNYYWEGYM